MGIALSTPGGMLASALAAAADGREALLRAIDVLPAPIFVTDAEGLVVHFNSACTAFAGREPQCGKDRWCVSWKLYSQDGQHLPHDQCPMAVALKSGRPVRGVSAIAERPNGERVSFVPFPTPFFDGNGILQGAINLLIDVTDGRQIAELRAQAQRCVQLANDADDPLVSDVLHRMAAEHQAEAAELERSTLRQ